MSDVTVVGGLIEELINTYEKATDEVFIRIRNELSGETTLHKIYAVEYINIADEEGRHHVITINAETDATHDITGESGVTPKAEPDDSFSAEDDAAAFADYIAAHELRTPWSRK